MSPEWLECSIDKNEFYYYVTDSGMDGDRIFKGDTVLVKQQNIETICGICLLVLPDHRPILRRLKKEGNKFILLPSNLSFMPEEYDDAKVRVIGRVAKVIINV